MTYYFNAAPAAVSRLISFRKRIKYKLIRVGTHAENDRHRLLRT